MPNPFGRNAGNNANANPSQEDQNTDLANAQGNGDPNQQQDDPPAGDNNGSDNQGQGNNDDQLQDNGGDKSDPPPPPAPPASNSGKVCLKSEAIKGMKIIVGKDTVQADGDGVIEVDAVQAERLLTIPGYEKV
jgi:hypothetical protein